MKLLFLDIDGVMTSNELVSGKRSAGLLYPFSPGCVAVLNEILGRHKPKIILTSSWRTVFDVEKQCRIFRENGVIQMPFGATTDFGYENRSLEIRNYLAGKKVESFAILDDMEIGGFGDNFLRIDPRQGLSKWHIPLVDKILGRAPAPGKS